VAWGATLLISGVAHLFIMVLCILKQSQPTIAFTVNKRPSMVRPVYLAERSSRDRFVLTNKVHTEIRPTANAQTLSKIPNKKAHIAPKKERTITRAQSPAIKRKKQQINPQKAVMAKRESKNVVAHKASVAKTCRDVAQRAVHNNISNIPVDKKSAPAEPVIREQEQKKEKNTKSIRDSTRVAGVDKNKGETRSIERAAVPEEITVGVSDSSYEGLQEQLSQHWHIPVGVRPIVGCIVRVSINGNGALSCITMVRESGMLMYDASVKMACARVDWPACMRGKELTIIFG